MDELRDLELLVRSRYPLITVETLEEQRLCALLGKVAESLGVPLFQWSQTQGLVRGGSDKGVYDTADPLKLFQHLILADTDGIVLLADVHPFLGDARVARRLREVAAAYAGERRSLVLSGPAVPLPPELRRYSVPFRLAPPGAAELLAEAKRVVIEYEARTGRRAQYSEETLRPLVDNLRGLSLGEARRAVHMALIEDGRLDESDFDRLLAAKMESVGSDGVLEHVPAPEGLDRVGGMQGLKRWLDKRKDALSERARSFGLDPPRGLLLLGVQGCGKSLVARCVAASWRRPLLRLDPGTLYDKYVGETEKRLRDALDTVEALAPLVLWIDEIEKGLGAGDDSDGGVSRRLLGTFLTWFQERKAPVFTVATANDVSALPPELLRKGRFDEIFFVDLPTLEERRDVLAMHLRQRDRDPGAFDLDALAAASDGFSGAELEQAVVAALYTAFSLNGPLSTELIRQEIEVAVPLSVTLAEKVQALRAWARERAVPAR